MSFIRIGTRLINRNAIEYVSVLKHDGHIYIDAMRNNTNGTCLYYVKIVTGNTGKFVCENLTDDEANSLLRKIQFNSKE